MPVVIGFDYALGALFVLCLVEQVAGKGGKCGETHRGENTIGVHIADAFINRVNPLAHIFIAQWLHAVFFLGPADHRVESHIGDLVAVIEPEVLTVFLHKAGRDCLQFLFGHVVVEHFRGFDNVVIYTDEYHVFDVHGVLLCFCSNSSNRINWINTLHKCINKINKNRCLKRDLRLGRSLTN